MVLKRIQNALWDVHWYVSGEVATTVVEEYDDTADAILYPLASLAVVSVLVYGLVTFNPSSIALTALLYGTMGLLTPIFGDRVLVSLLATKVYFTERTTEPMLPEVSR